MSVDLIELALVVAAAVFAAFLVVARPAPATKRSDPDRIAALEHELGIGGEQPRWPDSRHRRRRAGRVGLDDASRPVDRSPQPPVEVQTIVHFTDGGSEQLNAADRAALGPPDRTGRYRRPPA